jgi:hypothetical protein
VIFVSNTHCTAVDVKLISSLWVWKWEGQQPEFYQIETGGTAWKLITVWWYLPELKTCCNWIVEVVENIDLFFVDFHCMNQPKKYNTASLVILMPLCSCQFLLVKVLDIQNGQTMFNILRGFGNIIASRLEPCAVSFFVNRG